MEMKVPVARVGDRKIRPAERPQDLAGRTLGLLSNNKPNADLLLDNLIGGLTANYLAGSTHRQNKGAASRPSTEEMLASFDGVGLVINAICD